MKCYRQHDSLLCTIIEDSSVERNFLWWMLSIFSPSAHLIHDLSLIDPTEARVIGRFIGKTIELAPEAHLDGRIFGYGVDDLCRNAGGIGPRIISVERWGAGPKTPEMARPPCN